MDNRKHRPKWAFFSKNLIIGITNDRDKVVMRRSDHADAAVVSNLDKQSLSRDEAEKLIGGPLEQFNLVIYVGMTDPRFPLDYLALREIPGPKLTLVISRGIVWHYDTKLKQKIVSALNQEPVSGRAGARVIDADASEDAGWETMFRLYQEVMKTGSIA